MTPNPGPKLVGSLKIYTTPDHVSISENEVWIDALFTDEASALSWHGHWGEAEREFRKDRSKNLGARS